MPDPHDESVASQATRPTEHDVAIAEEAILGALAEGRVAHVTNMVEVVGTRFADEPTPALFAQLQDVTEEDCRAGADHPLRFTGCSELAATRAPVRWCGYVPRWAFEAFARYVIIVGGVFATVGAFASGTISGLPAGAVLASAGIWVGMSGSAMLWYVDNNMPPWGLYESIF